MIELPDVAPLAFDLGIPCSFAVKRVWNGVPTGEMDHAGVMDDLNSPD